MVLSSYPHQNRMREALVLYHSIVTSPYFKEIPVILFMNKADLLRKKCRSGIEVNMIKNSYPEFNGDSKDWKAVFRFIEKMFVDSCKSEDVKDEKIRTKKVYSHMVSSSYWAHSPTPTMSTLFLSY